MVGVEWAAGLPGALPVDQEASGQGLPVVATCAWLPGALTGARLGAVCPGALTGASARLGCPQGHQGRRESWGQLSPGSSGPPRPRAGTPRPPHGPVQPGPLLATRSNCPVLRATARCGRDSHGSRWAGAGGWPRLRVALWDSHLATCHTSSWSSARPRFSRSELAGECRPGRDLLSWAGKVGEAFLGPWGQGHCKLRQRHSWGVLSCNTPGHRGKPRLGPRVPARPASHGEVTPPRPSGQIGDPGQDPVPPHLRVR